LYNKEKLLANGDMAEAEIAANLQADHVSSRLRMEPNKLTRSSTVNVAIADWMTSVGVRRESRSGERTRSSGATTTAYALISHYQESRPASKLLVHLVMDSPIAAVLSLVSLCHPSKRKLFP
jgi:hypothetical protein